MIADWRPCPIKQVAVVRIQHPAQHGPGHLRETRQEIMPAHRESGDAVMRVRNDLLTDRKFSHRETLRRHPRRIVGKACADLDLRIGMQSQFNPRGPCRALERMIVRCRANTAKTEDDVLPRKRAAQRRRDEVRIVAQVLATGKLQPALGERRNPRAMCYPGLPDMISPMMIA
jgi:hypothetical protein